MRILSITAGAGGMYCGSCFRDNALAAELLRQGHDVTLLPTYTPTRTDEPNVSEPRVFFGGIGVYLQQHFSLFRRTPWFVDRLWDSPLAIRLATRFSVKTDPRLLGELTLSMLRGEEGFQQKEILKLLQWLGKQPLPDIITLPNSLLIGLAAPLRRALGRPVLCTLQGEDLFLEGLGEAYRDTALELIRKQVDSVDGFVAVSEYYANFMSQYLGISPSKMSVVPLGIDLEGYETRARPPGERVFTIGYFARVAPEKGLHRLIESYRRLRESGELPRARLEVAGYVSPEHRGYLREIHSRIQDWGLGDEFHYRGVLDRRGKIEFLQGLDVLSVPSGYREPKGIYLLETMACGIPVVQPRYGAFPEIIEKTGGGLLVDSEEGDTTEGLLRLWKDPSLAEELGRKGSEGVRRHYNLKQMAERSLEVYERYRGERDSLAATPDEAGMVKSVGAHDGLGK